MWLLVVALFGLIVPNGLFVYWLLTDFHGMSAVMHDKLAVSFILDALITLVVLTVRFARKPAGRVAWPWFVLFSLVGGLCFGLPFFWWLNRESAATPAAATTPRA